MTAERKFSWFLRGILPGAQRRTFSASLGDVKCSRPDSTADQSGNERSYSSLIT
jgi:hypothetical protein